MWNICSAIPQRSFLFRSSIWIQWTICYVSGCLVFLYLFMCACEFFAFQLASVVEEINHCPIPDTCTAPYTCFWNFSGVLFSMRFSFLIYEWRFLPYLAHRIVKIRWEDICVKLCKLLCKYKVCLLIHFNSTKKYELYTLWEVLGWAMKIQRHWSCSQRAANIIEGGWKKTLYILAKHNKKLRRKKALLNKKVSDRGYGDWVRPC